MIINCTISSRFSKPFLVLLTINDCCGEMLSGAQIAGLYVWLSASESSSNTALHPYCWRPVDQKTRNCLKSASLWSHYYCNCLRSMRFVVFLGLPEPFFLSKSLCAWNWLNYLKTITRETRKCLETWVNWTIAKKQSNRNSFLKLWNRHCTRS